jgi:hypothetical protein
VDRAGLWEIGSLATSAQADPWDVSMYNILSGRRGFWTDKSDPPRGSLCRGEYRRGMRENGKMDFARFLQQSMGSASELECHLLIARDLHFLDPEIHSELETRVIEIKRMLSSLLERVRGPVLTEN